MALRGGTERYFIYSDNVNQESITSMVKEIYNNQFNRRNQNTDKYPSYRVFKQFLFDQLFVYDESTDEFTLLTRYSNQGREKIETAINYLMNEDEIWLRENRRRRTRVSRAFTRRLRTRSLL